MANVLPKSVADMLTFPQLFRFLRSVNPSPIVCDLLLEPFGLLVVAGGAMAIELAARAVSNVKCFSFDMPEQQTVVHTSNGCSQTVTAGPGLNYKRFNELRMMAKGLPQIRDSLRGTPQHRRAEMIERRKLVLGALQKYYSADIEATEDKVFKVETRNMCLRDAISSLQSSAASRSQDIDDMLAAVIEMKSSRSNGPVTHSKRSARSSASTKSSKTKATKEEIAAATAAGITEARQELESDGDSLSLDSPFDNKSSGDWYWDNSSTYIESDSSSLSESAESVVTVRSATGTEYFNQRRNSVNPRETGAGDVQEMAVKDCAKNGADGDQRDSSTIHKSDSTTQTVTKKDDIAPSFPLAVTMRSSKTVELGLPKESGHGARPKDMPQLTKHAEVKPCRSNYVAAEFTPTDNLRPGSKITPLEISTATEFRPDDDLSTSSRSPSSKDSTVLSNSTIGKRQRRQGEKRKIKMAVHRRRVTSSAEGGAAKNDRAARSDYSSDDSEEENAVLAMKRSLYKMPKMSDQLVAVVSKPLPTRGRYGADLRTVLAEMRLRQKADRVTKQTVVKSDSSSSCNSKGSDVSQCSRNSSTGTLCKAAPTKPARCMAKSSAIKKSKQQENAKTTSRRLPSSHVPASSNSKRRTPYSDETRVRKQRASGEPRLASKVVKFTHIQRKEDVKCKCSDAEEDSSEHGSASRQIITSELMPSCSIDLSDDDALSLIRHADM